MKQKWKVERSQKRCCACKIEFIEGTDFFSALYPVTGGGFMRRDFCLSCWPGYRDGDVPPLDRTDDENQAGLMPAGDYISFWKTRVCPPEKKKPRPRFDPRIALTVFTQVLEREQKGPDEVQLLFILGLSLVRRKILRMKGLSRSDGRSWMHLAKKSGRKEYIIEDPGLSEEDILSLLDRVGELLQMNIEGREDTECPSDNGESAGDTETGAADVPGTEDKAATADRESVERTPNDTAGDGEGDEVDEGNEPAGGLDGVEKC